MKRPSAPDPYRPVVDFMIVGTQKGGTNALYRFLRQHPQIGMASIKEVHLFDSVEYSGEWSPRQIDERYRPFFRHCPNAAVRGEATPIYLFFPEIARELKKYNSELKLIVLLRDPVERAISHYYMEKNRNAESRPLWWALLCERWRLHRCKEPRADGSAMRVCSYRTRGLYSGQLRNLYRYFRRDRVLILRSRDLRRNHDSSLRRVLEFLGVSPEVIISPGIHYVGAYEGKKHRAVSLLLWLSYLPERVRMRALLHSGTAAAKKSCRAGESRLASGHTQKRKSVASRSASP